MILSHRYRFIFIKTNKTAGTSVEIALSRHCGPQDILTPISPPDEALRHKLGCPAAQNYLARKSEASLADWARDRVRARRRPQFYNHMSALQIRALVPADVWQDYFKFCIERNPWDRVVSSYYWKNRTDPRQPIGRFLADGKHLNLKRKGSDLYTIEGRIVADRVCRFEDLDAELERIRRQLGIPEPLELPRAKATHRVDRRHYRDILSPDDRDRIGRDFAFEIQMFGYAF